MTEKPSLTILDEVFGAAQRTDPKPETLVSDNTEAHSKLKRNLSKALDRQDELLDGPTTTVGERMVIASVAATTVKAALSTDRTALKARADNVIEQVLLRAIVVRAYRGYEVRPEDVRRLKATPRGELEAALGPKWLATYDKMEAAAGPEGALKPPSLKSSKPDPEIQSQLNEAFGR